MRYEIQKWDGTTWVAVKSVNGHTQRNAIERSGLAGKVRAVESGRHWNAMPCVPLGTADHKPTGEPVGSPPSSYRPRPNRSRWSQSDRLRATKPITGRERMKVVMLDRPARVDCRFDKLDYTPDRYVCEMETRGDGREGSMPSPRTTTPAKDLTPKRLGFYR